MSIESVLHKRNILITNGSSTLSRELCEQLIEIYKCRVALVSTFKDINVPNPLHFHCDVTDRHQVRELASKLKNSVGTVELVIHQERGDGVGTTTEQAERFVNQTSNDVLGYVNLLTCFVPDMLMQGSGRIISIKNTQNNVQTATACQPEYDDLVESIFRSQENLIPNNAARGPESIRFSTIFYQNHNRHQQAKISVNLSLTESEIAQRILKGIESEKTHVRIDTRRNLFEFCSTNIVQLASFGLGKLQLRKSQKIPIKVQ